MTREEHDKLFQGILETTKRIFDKDGFLAPVVHCIKENETAVYVIAEMPNESAKDAVERLIVKLVNEGAEAICFAAESWMLDGDHWQTRKDYKSIEDNPHRIEVVMATYSTKRFEIVGMAKILREEPEDPWGISFSGEEKKPKLSEWDHHTNEGSKSLGRFAQFWEKARALHAGEN